jgi:hypothetical protein
MNQESNCLIFTKLGLGILSFLINLGFVIAGSIILDNTSDLSSNSEFSNVWICNLVLTILSGVGIFVLLNKFCQSDDNNNSSDLLATLGSLGVSIWALILYFDKTDLNLLKNESNELFILFEVRVYFTLVSFGLLGLVLLLSIIWCCYSLNQNTDEPEVRISAVNNDLNSIKI